MSFLLNSDMIDATMSHDSPREIVIPTGFTQEHHDALLAYLIEARNLNTAVWRQLYKGIDQLDEAQVITENATKTFSQIYEELVERPFANLYNEQLLETKDVSRESPGLAANFAR
jgi:hypothetical protein